MELAVSKAYSRSNGLKLDAATYVLAKVSNIDVRYQIQYESIVK